MLEIPSIVMKPSLDDIQQALNKTVQIMLKTTQVTAKRRRQLYIKPSQDTDLNVCLIVVVNESDICNFHLRFHFLWIVIALYI